MVKVKDYKHRLKNTLKPTKENKGGIVTRESFIHLFQY